MATLFADDFNRADGALTAGPDWQARGDGTRDTLQIVSGAVQDTVNDNGNAHVAGVSFDSAQWAEIDVTSTDSASPYVILRAQGGGDSYRLQFLSGNGIILSKVVGGVYSEIITVPEAPGTSSFSLRLEAQGSALKGFLNGTEVTSFNDTSLVGGIPGIGFGAASTDTIDNFMAGNFILPPTLTVTQATLTPGGTISGTYADYATIPTNLTVSDGTNTITIASPTITDNGDGTGSFSGTMPALPATGTTNLVLFGNVTVELT